MTFLKALTVRILVALIAFITGVSVNHLSVTQQRTAPIQTVNGGDETTPVVFEGVVLKVGPQVPASGVFKFYRLAKYRVDRVIYGQYEKREIVVGHLSLTTHELDEFEEGSRVRVTVERAKHIVSGYIQYEKEPVDTFFRSLAVHSGSCYDWED